MIDINRIAGFSSLLISIFIFSSSYLIASTNPWSLQSIEKENKVNVLERGNEFFPATEYAIFSLDVEKMERAMSLAPMESHRSFDSNVQIPIPSVDGMYNNYLLAESPVMAKELADKFPNIKSYRAISESSSKLSGRISYSPFGFHGVFQTSEGELYIEPFPAGQNQQYAVYYGSDVVLSEDSQHSLSCGVDPMDEFHKTLEDMDRQRKETPTAVNRSGSTLDLRVYRLALAATSAYSSLKGGTVESVMFSLNTAVNLLNEILEREVAVRMMLIPDNDQLIWLSSAGEPYQNLNQGSGLLGQNTDAIVFSGGIPFNDFDLGHVFTGGCSDVGGVVSGLACTSGKARGVTCHSSNNIGFIVRRIMAHEIAHQFGVSHTWNYCPNQESQRASGSAYEPGSGSTIMSYAGACGDQNIQNNNHNYYHVRSLDQFTFFTRFSPAHQNCAELIFTGNREPVLSLPYENGFSIPVNTPFKLTAEADDPDGDPITFCWEQMDLGPATALGNPTLNSPLFRSFEPTGSPTRYFPKLPDVISGNNNLAEQLPTYSRELNFRCTVRDNNPDGAAAVWEEVGFSSTESSGPFVITYPNLMETFVGGELVEVTWDVANTDRAPVNCKSVDILMSTNGGFTYPYVLMSNTPNTGSAEVNVPLVSGTNNRIKVRAADNIFFNITERSFIIEEAVEPGYIFNFSPYHGRLCLPQTLEVDYEMEGFLGFEDTVELSIIGGLPENTNVVEFPSTLTAGESGKMVLDMTEVNLTSEVEVEFAIVHNGDTLIRTLFFEVVTNDFSDLALVEPANGSSGLVQSFSFEWNKSANSQNYEIEIATDPTFSETSTVYHELLPNVDSTVPDIFFDPNTIYYWRVRPINICGPGEFTSPSAFQTRTLSCQLFESVDVPVGIPALEGSVKESIINLDIEGNVSEINLPRIKGLQAGSVGDIGVSLVSPQGTEVSLFRRKCSTLSHYDLGFDDQSPLILGCPVDTRQIYKPEEPLSELSGESLAGEWKLVVRRLKTGQTGQLQSWNMQICGNISSEQLGLIRNDTLFAPFLERTKIDQSLLSAEEISSAEEIVYTLVDPPQFGSLSYQGVERTTGFTFTQLDINEGKLKYTAEVNEELNDHFTFVVVDDRLAWNGIESFNIAIREDAISNVEELAEGENSKLFVFPNPSNGTINFTLQAGMGDEVIYAIYNSVGKAVSQGREVFQGNHSLELNHLPAGVYIIRVNVGKVNQSAIFVIQK
nr:proprotein convertase P-domain-containing protein [Saprospiraceae bacterium]